LRRFLKPVNSLLPGNDRDTIAWLKAAVPAALLAGVLLSPRLWLSARSFPLVPVWSWLPVIESPFDDVLSAALFALAIAVMWTRRPRLFIIALIGLVIALGLFDQSRWQPWVYQYTVMMMVIAAGTRDESDSRREKLTVDVCRVIIASIYFWSGLQKINVDFVTSTLPWLLAPVVRNVPPFVWPYLAATVAVIEAGTGVGLLIPRYRRLAVMLAVAMHVFVLAMVGPFGRSWNSVIWPWNIAMIAFVVSLFRNADPVSFGGVIATRAAALQQAALVLFLVMPALSFFNLWDSYLSFSLYSGNVNHGDIYLGADAAEHLSGDLYNYYTEEIRRRQDRINATAWSFGDLNVPVYPEPRIYKAIAASICSETGNSPDVVLVVHGRQTLVHREDERTYRCRDFRN